MKVIAPFLGGVDVPEAANIETGYRYDAQQRQQIAHFQAAFGHGRADVSERATPIESTERLETALRERGYTASPCPDGLPAQFTQKARGQLGHVAGNQKVPFGPGVFESSEQSPHGAQAGLGIAQNRPSEMPINIWIPKDCHPTDDLSHGRGSANDQGDAPLAKKRFVTPHAGAAATGQHEPCFPHERMITLQPSVSPVQLSLSNGTRSGYNRIKQMAAFCFIAAILSIGTDAKMRGADNINPAIRNAEPAPRLKSTVRVDAATGRLVRVMVPIPAARPHSASHPAPPDPAIQAVVEKTARTYDVSPTLVNSVISVESAYNPSAVSWKGAQGLMQLMPETARRFGVSNAFDVQQNVEGGVRYLRFLKDTFKDDRLAIAAYNAGEGAVAKYNGVPPYRETLDYVKKVGERLERAGKAEPGRKPAMETKSQAVAQPPPEEKQPPLVTFYDEHGRLHMVTQR